MRRRIVYLSPYFWPEETGSAPYCTDLALALAEAGAELAVESFRPHYPDAGRYPGWQDGTRDRETWQGMAIARAPVRPRAGAGAMRRLGNDLGYLRHVLAGLLAGRFRGAGTVIAYVPSVLTLYAAALLRLVTRAPVVAVVHDIESGLAGALGLVRGRGIVRALRALERFGLNRADRVVVLTGGMRDGLRALGCTRPISVLPIWAEVAPWADPPETNRPVLMYSGNFGRKQNLGQLLPLFARLGQEGVALEVVLRGDGSERAHLAARIAARGLTHVRLEPFAPAAGLVAALQAAAIHLVPQAPGVGDHALPSKAVAIMAAGRPFVCIADPGSPLERLARESGAGLSVPPGDEAALFAAVRDLAADRARQIAMGRSGQRHIAMHMERGRVLEGYRQIILAADGPGRPFIKADG